MSFFSNLLFNVIFYFTLKNVPDARRLNRSILFVYVRIRTRRPDNADGIFLSVKR